MESGDATGPSATDEEDDAAPLLDVLGDAVSREILAAAANSPVTVEGLATTCDVSESTVYRRLNQLSRLGLVERTSQLTTDEQGTYRTTMSGLYVAVDGDGIRVARNKTPTDPLAAAMQVVLDAVDLRQLRYDGEHNTVDLTVALSDDDFETFLGLYSDS